MDKQNEIGGLWLNESQKGTKYMAGKLSMNGQEVKVVIFKNTFKKEGEKTPDYRVYLQEDQRQAKPQQQGQSLDDFGGDDTPF